ncbi:ERI1 exoribonuclease 2 isoform X1 [Carcharodon carcharias]|uniref:ERI1 exoribonuclease 2 isoform X1 n=2 Tax=Carcharodon carcharias TaxID=13397 RepID=UPI001B7E3215|nr:ERI1 exoribonuclease 2 isoform X1 [Carcharodon carcharias]
MPSAKVDSLIDPIWSKMRQLGIIRKHSLPSLEANKKPKSNQFFSYLIIIDFESTCWKNGKSRYSPEIIEFPAVLLNTSNGDIEVEFHTYVQPQEHPILSAFCTELTGIEQWQVEAGIPLGICLSQFSRWIQKLQQEKSIVFIKDMSQKCGLESRPCAFVTWSDWDLGVCLHYECKRKDLRKPAVLNSWIDLRTTYKLFYNRKPKGLNGALQDLGIMFSGREHSGLDDARNTAHLAWQMICDGCTMKITKSLDMVAPMRNPIITLPTAISLEDGKTTHTSHEVLGTGSKTFLLSENSSGSTKKAENGQMSTNCEHSSVVKQTKLVLASCPKSSSQLMTTVDSRKCSDVNVHSECLLSSRTLINGLCTSTDLCKAQKSRLHLINNVKNQITVGGVETKPNNSPNNLLLMSTTVESVTSVSNLDISCSESEVPWEDWEDVAILPLSGNEYPKDYEGQEKNCKASSVLEEENTQDCSIPEPPLKNRKDDKLTGQLEPKKHQKVIYRSSQTTIYDVAEVMKQAERRSIFKVPTMKVPIVRSNSFSESTESSRSIRFSRSDNSLCIGVKRKDTHSSPCKPHASKKPSFNVYSDKSLSSNCSLPLINKSISRVIPPTTNAHQALRKLNGEKITPPLCGCGRRAKRLTVSKMGPNQGKAFYSCAAGKRNAEDSKGCGYFKWEWALKKEKSFSASSANISGTGSSGTFPSSQRKHLGLRFSF